MEWMRLEDQEFWQQPWVIRVLSGPYSSLAKLLFLRVLDCGADGCCMHNETLAEEVNRSGDAVRRAIESLRSGGALIVTGNKDHCRRMFPARAPGLQVGA